MLEDVINKGNIADATRRGGYYLWIVYKPSGEEDSNDVIIEGNNCLMITW